MMDTKLFVSLMICFSDNFVFTPYANVLDQLVLALQLCILHRNLLSELKTEKRTNRLELSKLERSESFVLDGGYNFFNDNTPNNFNIILFSN